MVVANLQIASVVVLLIMLQLMESGTAARSEPLEGYPLMILSLTLAFWQTGPRTSAAARDPGRVSPEKADRSCTDGTGNG